MQPIMKPQHLLSGVWESYPSHLADNYASLQSYSMGTHLADILAIGPVYYYTIHTSDYSLSHSTNKILSIHGLDSYPKTLQDIITLIHPEDLDFVMAAEKARTQKIQEIGVQQQLHHKTSYCFRMRMGDGSYHLFHHQAILLAKDEEKPFASVLHIHTDIQHITTVNNKVVIISHIGKRNDSYKIVLSEDVFARHMSLLSKREVQVLELLSQGLSSRQIAEKLYVSAATVRVHRQHLLKKTKTTNTSSLIKKCIELKLI